MVIRRRGWVWAVIIGPLLALAVFVMANAERWDADEIWFPFSDRFDRPSQLLQLHQSVWLILAGGVLLWTARASNERLRRRAAIATLLLVGALAWTDPISSSFVRMGDSGQIAESRAQFEGWVGVNHIRYEAHLSYAILGQLYRLNGTGDDASARAQAQLARAACAWFLFCALAVGYLERWSPMVMRYLALALLVPGTLLYFGWREVGYLSLNVATFPLLIRGLRDGAWHLDASGALAGLGAALHGLGLVSLFGAWLAALAARARLADRIARFLPHRRLGYGRVRGLSCGLRDRPEAPHHPRPRGGDPVAPLVCGHSDRGPRQRRNLQRHRRPRPLFYRVGGRRAAACAGRLDVARASR